MKFDEKYFDEKYIKKVEKLKDNNIVMSQEIFQLPGQAFHQ